MDGRLLFAVGNNGDLACLESDTGKLVWKKSYPADFGGKCMSGWGYSESPLVDGDRLIVVPGAPDAGMAALNKKTGEVIWKSEQPDFGRAGKDGAGYTGVVISQMFLPIASMPEIQRVTLFSTATAASILLSLCIVKSWLRVT